MGAGEGDTAGTRRRPGACGVGETFEDLYDDAPAGQLTLTGDGVVVAANRTLRRWLGDGFDGGEPPCPGHVRDLLTPSSYARFRAVALPHLLEKGRLRAEPMELAGCDVPLAVIASGSVGHDRHGRRLVRLTFLDVGPAPPRPGAARRSGGPGATGDDGPAPVRPTAVLDGITEQAIVAFDSRGRLTTFNAGAERLCGRSSSEVRGTAITALHDPLEVVERAAALGIEPGIEVLTHLPSRGVPETRQWTWRTASGRRQVRLTVTALEGDGDSRHYVAVADDVTERARTEQALNLSEKRNRLAFDNAPIGMAIVAIEGRDAAFTRVNRALCDMFRADPEWVTGQRADRLLGVEAPLLDIRRSHRGGFHRVQRQARRADGSEAWLLVSGSHLHDEAAPDLIVVQVEDVTDSRRAEERLEYLAFRDPLTGLANRARLLDELDRAVRCPPCETGGVGVMFIDLDNFKTINDSLGHETGDAVLVEVAHRIGGCLGPNDRAGRLGGDEFVIISAGVGNGEPARQTLTGVARRIHTALEPDITVGERRLRVTASMGLVVSEPGATPAELLRDADAAMYQAKEHGRSRWEFATPALHARAIRHLDLEGELRLALRDDPAAGHLLLEYQPCVDMTSGRVVGVESLVRWRHPTAGLRPPAAFLDVAEKSGLIVPLGRWVLDNALADARRWMDRHGSHAPELWVNVSSRQIERTGFAEDLATLLDRHGVPASQVCLEITERQLIAHDAGVEGALHELSELGVDLAIDDFGTGYAGLDYLRRLPFSTLKLDRSYLIDPDVGSLPARLAAGIAAIGRALELTIVGEGIETEAQLRFAESIGCDVAQGFLLARPMPVAAVDDVLDHGLGHGLAVHRRP